MHGVRRSTHDLNFMQISQAWVHSTLRQLQASVARQPLWYLRLSRCGTSVLAYFLNPKPTFPTHVSWLATGHRSRAVAFQRAAGTLFQLPVLQCTILELSSARGWLSNNWPGGCQNSVTVQQSGSNAMSAVIICTLQHYI